MRVVLREERTILLRFFRGEEFVATLQNFCEQENIKGAWIEGLGAVDETEISYYDIEAREYKRKSFSGEFEILNLTGNIALKEDKPFLHAHVTLSGPDFGAFGGHLHALRISGTGEVLLRHFETKLTRKPDEETGLWLLH